MKNRITYFDQMKGMAIIMVVMGHIIQFAFGFERSDVVDMMGVFYMPLFFYISGYFSYRIYDNLRSFSHLILKRTSSLVVPLITFSAIWCIWRDIAIVDFVKDGFTGYWFIYILLILHLFFNIFGYLIQKVEKSYLYVVLWLLPYAGLVLLKIYFQRHQIIDSTETVNLLVNYYRYYLIGYLCCKYKDLRIICFENSIVFAFGFLCFFLQWYYCSYHNIALIFTGAVGAIIVVQNFTIQYLDKENRMCTILTNIGQSSLAIYMIHYFIIPDISEPLMDVLDIQNPFIWHFAWSFILAVPVIFFCMCLEKII